MLDQKRKERRKEHRKRQKMLHIPECVQWGSYSLDFLMFANTGIIELQSFIRELDNEAKSFFKVEFTGLAQNDLDLGG